MSPPDYYTLYLNTANPTSSVASPYNNVTVVSSGPSTFKSITTYLINWDALFNNKQGKYKKCFLRCVFASEYNDTQSSGNTVPFNVLSNRGMLSLTGISQPKSNCSQIILGPLETTPSELQTRITTTYGTGTATGTVSGGILTATSETGNITDKDYFVVSGVYYPVLSTTGTAGTRTFYSSLPTNATSTTYNASRVVFTPYQRFYLDTTSSVPEEIVIPTGSNQITVRTTNYAAIATSLATNININNVGIIPIGNYMLKLIFECYE